MNKSHLFKRPNMESPAMLAQVQLMTRYLVKGKHQDEKEVPDPFHGGPENFEKVRVAITD